MRFPLVVPSILAALSIAPAARAQRLNPPEAPGTRLDETPPPSIDEAPPVPEGSIDLEFTTDDPDLELRLPSGTRLETKTAVNFRHMEYMQLVRKPKYETACFGPCTLHVSSGTFRLALGKGDQESVEGDSPVEIDGPSRVHGELTDKSGLRTAGKVILGVGAAGGLGLVFAAASMNDDSSSKAFFHAGLITLGAGGIAAVILLLQSDHAHFTVTPLMGGAHEGMLPRGAAFSYVF